jgi:hypothetical protein
MRPLMSFIERKWMEFSLNLIKKVYDEVKWPLLHHALHMRGLPPKYCEWIAQCL